MRPLAYATGRLAPGVVTVADRARLERAMLGLFAARGLPAPVEQPVCLVHYGEARTKQRHRDRAGGHGHFTPGGTKRRERTLRDLYALTFAGRGAYAGAVAMVGIFCVHDALHRDGDNLLKLAKDAANPRRRKKKKLGLVTLPPPAPIVWRDDAQVTAEITILELDRENPRTLLAFAPTRSSVPRYPKTIRGERACVHCGCTEERACPGGCAWVAAHVCSTCRALGLG